MLILAYQAWTPNEPRSTDTNRDGSVTVWELSPDQLRSVTYQQARRTTVIERREEQGDSYLWGTSFEPAPPDSSAETATGEAAQSLAVAQVPAQAEEFALGEEGDDIWQRLAQLRALRDLGVLDDAAKEQYELNDPERRLTVATADTERTLEVGGIVHASNHRYAFDPNSGRGYVLADEIARVLEGGSSTLRLRTLHRFSNDDVATVTVRGMSGERTMMRRAGASRPADIWVSPDSPDEPDQTFQNFMNHVRQLAYSSFESAVSVDTLQFLVRIDYVGEAEAELGFLELHRVAASEPGSWEYYLRTETTRIPTLAYRGFAERVDRDLADLF
jgi:hypothetical protein